MAKTIKGMEAEIRDLKKKVKMAVDDAGRYHEKYHEKRRMSEALSTELVENRKEIERMRQEIQASFSSGEHWRGLYMGFKEAIKFADRTPEEAKAEAEARGASYEQKIGRWPREL